uniref:Uncharacterized protein n=1 Tax=Manihot esculenta TaxID=3983 RepID=A0A2C9UU99_MANES
MASPMQLQGLISLAFVAYMVIENKLSIRIFIKLKVVFEKFLEMVVFVINNGIERRCWEKYDIWS